MTTNPNLLETFDEKVNWFLSYLYENGGNEYKHQNYLSDRSYLIPGAANPDEFNRIMRALKGKHFVTWDVQPTMNGHFHYVNVLLSEEGRKEAKKELPQVPMFSLFSQEITTGDLDTDGKINHAKDLFFTEPQTMDRMRSACEALSFVIEPMRKDLKKFIADADVEHFFQLVNKFDIRHNNDYTKNLQHPEQLEWVFYSLLNTINTYTKLKKRLQP